MPFLVLLVLSLLIWKLFVCLLGRDKSGKAINRIGRDKSGSYGVTCSSLLKTLPIKDFGKLSRNSRCLGTLYGVNSCLQKARISCFVSSVGAYPGLRTTKAATVSPRYSSGAPATAASSTAGCWNRTSSTSRG